jgi:hypothetical protein
LTDVTQYCTLSTVSTIRTCGAAQRWCGPLRSPQLSQRDLAPLGLCQAVELEVDRDVIWIVQWAEHAVRAHAQLLPADGIAVECGLPQVEVADCMLEARCRHGYVLPSFISLSE